MLNVTKAKKDIWYSNLVYIESLQDLVDKMQQEENVCNVWESFMRGREDQLWVWKRTEHKNAVIDSGRELFNDFLSTQIVELFVEQQKKKKSEI